MPELESCRKGRPRSRAHRPRHFTAELGLGTLSGTLLGPAGGAGSTPLRCRHGRRRAGGVRHVGLADAGPGWAGPCLLYTSDAADEEDSVDLGGRRIIKKKKKE